MKLTRREFQALSLLPAADKEIAFRLQIARATASKHIQAGTRKLGAANRTEAALILASSIHLKKAA